MHRAGFEQETSRSPFLHLTTRSLHSLWNHCGKKRVIIILRLLYKRRQPGFRKKWPIWIILELILILIYSYIVHQMYILSDWKIMIIYWLKKFLYTKHFFSMVRKSSGFHFCKKEYSFVCATVQFDLIFVNSAWYKKHPRGHLSFLQNKIFKISRFKSVKSSLQRIIFQFDLIFVNSA